MMANKDKPTARQYVSLDPVLAKNLLVPIEPQPLKPRRYVHAVILGSEERQPPSWMTIDLSLLSYQQQC